MAHVAYAVELTNLAWLVDFVLFWLHLLYLFWGLAATTVCVFEGEVCPLTDELGITWASLIIQLWDFV